MLRVLLLILLAPLLGFIAVRVGWPWLIVAITLAWAIWFFVLLKDAPSKTRIVFFSSAFVLQNPDNLGELFPYDEVAQRNKVRSASGSTWATGVAGMTEREARNVRLQGPNGHIAWKGRCQHRAGQSVAGH